MRLKSLDIKGFKSFADKTQVLLDNPITGIVGPNGCGKSNIVDAIRWVIGEHKIKTLRSDNLSDLVFNGTKNRSASGMAEVSLTFENTKNLLPTEFSSVTVTRKFFRSGESEYRLNDVPCRLKDIHNLFMDTGISSDSYAIIELGMVDDIIRDKDNSRRRMLEQAAGISVYKNRKKEAEKKLESTQQDLDRIEDILFEIGNNMRSLETQAKKAERYIKLKNEYKEVSLDLARVTLQDFNGQYQSIQQKLDEEEDKRIKVTASIADDEAEIESQKLNLTQQEQELAITQKKFNELLAAIRNLESEKKLSAQHLQHLKGREIELKTMISNAQEQLKNLKTTFEATQNDLQQEENEFLVLKEKVQTVRDLMDEKRKVFDVQKKSLEEKRTSFQNVRNEQFGLEKKSIRAEAELNNLKQSQSRIDNENVKRAQSIKELKEEESKLNQQAEEQTKLLNELEKRGQELKKSIVQTQEEINQIREKETVKNRSLDARKNEYDLLKSLVDNLEGYPGSIKFLKKNKTWNANAPLLSDIFSVKKEYRVALEAVLDQFLNFYVVKNEAEAQQAIKLLRDNKKGKANFFLLNRLAPQITASENPVGGLTKAMEVVEFDAEYGSLVQHLLARVFIAETEEQLTDFPAEYVVVAKDGHFISRQNSLTGGSVGAFEGNKIGRTKNLSHLEEEITELKNELNTLGSQKKEQLSKLQQLQKEASGIDLNEANRRVNQFKNKAANCQSRIEYLNQLNADSEKEANSILEKVKSLESNSNLHQSQLSEIISQANALQQEVAEEQKIFQQAETDYDKASKDYNQHFLTLNKQQSKIDRLKQELGFSRGQSEGLSKQIANNTKQLSETSEQIGVTSGKLNFGNNELEELLEKKEADNKKLSEKDRVYYALRNKIQEHEQKISRQRKEKELSEKLVNELKEKLNEMRLHVAGIKERLSVEFHVDLEEILGQERTTELDKDALQEDAEKLKGKLERIGDVNPTAVEAFQEIKIRYDFISEQKEDLETAKNNLVTTIEEVERTANARFEDTFNKVRENFIHVFKELFTSEDQADLKLTDPENVAESGIEIYAQPKGKRPSTLTQLSGGEKTLTSTAFLFAIYLIKPAPFCILDEVDAPLDDANLIKFSNMIRKFSDNSQFIIITHNKQTMAAVDVIYGVTMQELGVSKIVPVDFRSLN